MKKSGTAARSVRAGTAMTLILGVGGALSLAPSAFAQGAVEAIDEEIVITATKRGDALAQDVPLAVTAYSAEQLQALNFQDFQSLSYTMPNVQLEDIGSIALYGNNLTDEVTYGGDTVLPDLPCFGGVGAPTNTFSPLNEGRVIGAEFRFRY